MAPVRTIAVIIAMEAEAAPLVEHLKLVKARESPLPGPIPALVFSGDVHGAKVHVVTNGKSAAFGVDCVGTVPASLTAYGICLALKPDILVNAGTAGGFKAMGGAIGDVYLASAFKNHDRRIPIPGFDTYAIGAVDAFPTPALRAAMGFKDGVVSTGNSLDAPEVDLASLKANDASVKEMEAAGNRAHRGALRRAVRRGEGHHGHRGRGPAHRRRVHGEPRRGREGAPGGGAEGDRIRRGERALRAVTLRRRARDYVFLLGEAGSGIESSLGAATDAADGLGRRVGSVAASVTTRASELGAGVAETTAGVASALGVGANAAFARATAAVSSVTTAATQLVSGGGGKGGDDDAVEVLSGGGGGGGKGAPAADDPKK